MHQTLFLLCQMRNQTRELGNQHAGERITERNQSIFILLVLVFEESKVE